MKRECFEYLVPREGQCVPVPEDRFAPMPAEGLRVRMSPYWDHLVSVGAVSVAAEPSASTEPAPAPKASKDRS